MLGLPLQKRQASADSHARSDGCTVDSLSAQWDGSFKTEMHQEESARLLGGSRDLSNT